MPVKKPTAGKKTVAKSTPNKTAKSAAKPATKAPAKSTAKPAAAKPPAKSAPAKTVAAKSVKPVAKSDAKKPAEKTVAKAAGKAPAKPAAKAPVKAAAKKPAAPSAKTQTTAKPNKPAAKTTVQPAKASPKKSVEKSAVNTQKQSANSKSAQPTLATFAPYQAATGEDYMNEEQKNHFRDILLQWKANLMEEVDRTVTHMKDEAANFPDPADRATQEEEFSFELRTRDRERKLIKKIDQTLERIDNDDYGYCDACGVDIGIKRLEARPTATLCIDCKTLAEIREKQEHG
jgi:DnaK suppressor protein